MFCFCAWEVFIIMNFFILFYYYVLIYTWCIINIYKIIYKYFVFIFSLSIYINKLSTPFAPVTVFTLVIKFPPDPDRMTDLGFSKGLWVSRRIPLRLAAEIYWVLARSSITGVTPMHSGSPEPRLGERLSLQEGIGVKEAACELPQSPGAE